MRPLSVRSGVGALSAALIAAMLPAVFMAAPAAAAPQCLPSAPDPVTALNMAVSCGARIEIESLRSETGLVFANPDGTADIEESGYPQRVRRSDGSWSDLDATLVRNSDGTWSPRASLVDLRLSGGGSGDLVRGRRAGTELALAWPGRLPEPAVSGAVATYAEVLPGVDLVVTALETGFSEVLVVKHRAAAANPALRRLAFGSRLSGLTWQTDGALRAVDASGEEVLAATAPLMWDSRGEGTSRPSGPGLGARVAPIGLKAAAGELVLEPDAGLLADPEARFPVFIDPTVAYSAWTMINKNYPDQSYWSYDRTDCPSGYSTECAKVGYISGYGPTVTYRSIWRFPTSGFHGKQVRAAKFTIDLLHSFSCTNYSTELRSTGSISSSTDWNNHASTWSGTVTASVSNNSCNQARKLTEFSGSLASTLQGVANGSATYTYWGLKAASESSNNYWKKFDAKTAKLVVTVNTIPGVPTDLTADGKGCVRGSSRPFISTATPTLRAKLYDADGNTMTGYFEWAPINSDGTYGTISSPLSQSSVPSGSYAQVTLSARPDGKYAYRAWAQDPYATGSKSAWCEFEIDTVAPAVPTVTSDIYKEGSSGCDGGACGSVGQTGSFTFSSSSDTQTFRWGFTDPPSTTVTPSTLGAAVSVDWTPTAAGPHTIFVKAIDRAGNESTKVYQFYVAQPSIAIARWRMNDAPGTTVLPDDTGHGNTITLYGATPGARGRILPGGDGQSRTATSFDGVDDYASRPALLDTGTSFSVSAWVKLDTKTADHTVVSQQGNYWSAFYLQYDSSLDRWVLEMPSGQDQTPEPTWYSAKSTTVPQAGVWTHLVGTYDPAAKQLQLYVNGNLEGTSTGLVSWNATGNLRIGRSGATWFAGSIAEVQVWDRVIGAAEVFHLYDPVKSLVGKWDMEDVGPGPTWDASELVHDLNFYPQPGGPVIPPADSGHTGTGLRLDGIDDHAVTDMTGPVLDTSQSFTVSAWVFIDADVVLTERSRTFISQQGNQMSGFYLGVRNFSGVPRWSFTMTDSDSDSPGTWWHASSSTGLTSSHQNKWVHVMATYNAGTRVMRLYIDGALAGSATRTTPAWHATGPLTIGRALFTPAGGQPTLADAWKGNVDEVRAYQAVLPENLALHRSVTSSSPCASAEGPEKAVNGSWTGGNTDKWCSYVSSRWLQADLGAAHTISSVTLRHAGAGGEPTVWNTKDFNVLVSADGSTWTTVATVTGNTANVTTHTFVPTTARHVRLNVIDSASDNNAAARIYELEVR